MDNIRWVGLQPALVPLTDQRVNEDPAMLPSAVWVIKSMGPPVLIPPPIPRPEQVW